MYIKKEISLVNFEFWSGAKNIAERLRPEELMIIELWLEEMSEEINIVFTETDINDFFWFDEEAIAEILGFENEERMWDELAEREVN